MKQILLYDTTMRDGTQGENISFTVEEKIKVAKRLDDLGINYIEGGWPGSNPADDLFFEVVKKQRIKNAKIVAFGSTLKNGLRPYKDKNIQKLLESKAKTITLFGKTWKFHIQEIMEISLKENLSMIRESISYIKDAGREVIYDAEHFFDGYKDDPDYALKTIFAASEAGAEAIIFCDTNGGTMPYEIESILKKVYDDFNPPKIKTGIHAHNDCGLAVANTISAVRSGATIVQGTMNGYGERSGNADLTSVIPILKIKMNLNCISFENMAKLKKVSRFISEVANVVPLNNRPFVGKSAFAHKGGTHVYGIIKNKSAYEHIQPELVGNKRRVLISELSGKSNIKYKAEELRINIEQDLYPEIVEKIKRLEQQGYSFDSADGSFKILLQKFNNQFKPLFRLESFRVTIEKDKNFPCSAHATAKISVEGKDEITAAEGDGPVSALDNALRKALCRFFPSLDSMRLVDFKVRVIDGSKGTAAKVRVHIDSRDSDSIWSTVGVSNDIIEASWLALEDSFHYKLAKEETD